MQNIIFPQYRVSTNCGNQVSSLNSKTDSSLKKLFIIFKSKVGPFPSDIQDLSYINFEINTDIIVTRKVNKSGENNTEIAIWFTVNRQAFETLS